MSHDFSKYPLTLEGLSKLLEEKFPKQLNEESVLSPQEVAIWFLCFFEARELSESYRLKDIAWLFKEGVAPMKERVEEVLVTRWEEYLNEVDGKQTWVQDLSPECILDLESRYQQLIEDITVYFKK